MWNHPTSWVERVRSEYPEWWEAILRGLRSGDLAEQLWARHQSQWYDQGDEAFVPTFFDPRVWDATNDDSVA